MSYLEVKNKIEELSTEWEQFKAVNERKLKEEAKSGSADALTEAHLNRLNKSMDACADVLTRMEVAGNRPGAESSGVPLGANIEHKKAFTSYVRRGNDAELAGYEQKALSTEKDTDGGYLVTPEMAGEIHSKLSVSTAMRQLASVTEVSADGLEILEDTGEMAAGWTSEGGARSDTKTPKINKRIIAVHELFAQPRATQKLLDDSKIDIESWLAAKIADSFAHLENTAFLYGDGLGKPKGILNYPVGNGQGQIERLESALNLESLEFMYADLDEEYKENAKFLMNHQTLAEIRTLKDKQGQYVYKPTIDGEFANKLLGLDVVLTPEMQGSAKGKDAVILGDFKKGYQIVDRTGITTLRDPFTQKPFVKFYTTKRVGGDVLDAKALKVLRVS